MGWVTLESNEGTPYHIFLKDKGNARMTAPILARSKIGQPHKEYDPDIHPFYGDKGYRVVEHPTWIGQKLRKSKVWNDEIATAKSLPGTAAFASYAHAEHYARSTPGGGAIIEISGKRVERPFGRDMLKGEISIKDAFVTKIYASRHEGGQEFTPHEGNIYYGSKEWHAEQARNAKVLVLSREQTLTELE